MGSLSVSTVPSDGFPGTPLAPAIVRIHNIGGAAIGAGFLVAKKWVLTCAHVVTSALGLPKETSKIPAGSLLLDFPLVAPNACLTAQVVRWQPQEDVAVLELEHDPPPGAEPVSLVEGGDLWGHPFRAFGFPPGHPDGVWASGLIRERNARGWLQIEDTKETGYRVQQGFSGSPVWDEKVGGVVGMVTAVELDPAVRAAFIIPSSLLLREISAILPVSFSPRKVFAQRPLNPFSDRGRINDPARFFDRQRILRDLRQMLAAGNSISLIGEPEIGKSSLLYYLYQTRAQWLPETVTALYLDLQGVIDPVDFCDEVMRGMGENREDLYALKQTLRRQVHLAAQAALYALKQTLRGRRVILLLDEVEKLARPAFSSELHDLLRALAQEGTVTLVVASHRPLVEIFPPSGPTSPFHNIFIEKRLDPFTPDEARAFLVQRLKGTGVDFTAQEIEQLVVQSGGHPAQLQRLAYELFERKVN